MGKRRALVIGCKYSGEDKLQGPPRDAKRIKEYLTEACGWEKKEVIVMTQDADDKDLVPKRSNIKKQIKKLVEFTKKKSGAQIWFSFSGHGFQNKDKNGDEKDKLDEIIWTSDFKEISDDEFYKWFVAKLPSGTNAFVLIDTCSSGTFSDLPYIFRHDEGSVKVASNVDKKTKANVLCASSCRDDQESIDGIDLEDGKPGGLGTSALLFYLKSASDSTTLKTLLKQVVSEVKDEDQEPVVTSGYKIDPKYTLNELGFPFVLPLAYQRNVPVKTPMDPEGPSDEDDSVPSSSCFCFNAK